MWSEAEKVSKMEGGKSSEEEAGRHLFAFLPTAATPGWEDTVLTDRGGQGNGVCFSTYLDLV